MGTYTEQNGVDRVWALLRDYGTTTNEQLMNDTEIKLVGLRGAEQHYSRIRPAPVVADLTANGTAFLSLPAGFLDGYSSVLSVETPPDKVPAEVIDPRDYYVGRTGAGALRLVFSGSTPANGATVRLVYTIQRVIAVLAANTTVPDPDFVAFCDLAASFCADSIAAKYARSSEPAIGAEVVNYRSRAMEWRDIAKRLWQRWEQAMGAGSGEGAGTSGPAASAWANWDMNASWGSYRTLRPRSTR